MPKVGSPEMKALVPSIGSSTQTYSGVRPLRAELLADDAVLRPAGGDQIAHGRLRRPIGDGDRTGVGLRFDLQALAEVGPDGRAGGVGQLLGEGPEGGDVGGGGSVGHGTIVAAGEVGRS